MNLDELKSLFDPCRLCPRECGARRSSDEVGLCGGRAMPSIASWNIHHGEEPPISGTRGSGTIFFSGCSLSCLFCQNYPISQLRNGRPSSIDELCGFMLTLQERGAHNINFVTPTHEAAAIAIAVTQARSKGLRIPIVYNSSGYERLETLRVLEGIVDIYLPDMKYGDDLSAQKCSGIGNYTAVNRAAISEMYRQVGDLSLDGTGVARRGIIIRHLVLPGGLSGSEAVFRTISELLGNGIHVSIMAQYHPAHLSAVDPVLGRRLTALEYQTALDAFTRAGLNNGWQQDL